MNKTLIRAIIVDDEDEARELIKLHLVDIGGVEILEEADGIQSAKEEILYHKPDVVFLDIELHGKPIFDMLKQMSKRKELTFVAVFVTAHFKTYLEAAMESCGLVRKFAYLSKPVDHDKMSEVIEKVRAEVNLKRKGQLILSSVNEKIITPYDEIFYCSTEGPDNKAISKNYVGIFTINGEKIYIKESLSQLYAKLPDDQFYKMSGSHIINRDYVHRIKSRNERYLCVLKCGSMEKVITVPERQYQALRSEFEDS